MKIINRILLLTWGILILLIFFSSLKEQVFVSNKLKNTLSIIFPQGWGFFTKSPREPMLEVYRVDQRNNMELVTLKNQSSSNFFGLSRRGRMIGYESSMIASQISQNLWKDEIMKNKFKLPKDTIIQIKKGDGKYFQRGIYLLVSYKIIPFIWANENQEANNPIKYTFIKVI